MMIWYVMLIGGLTAVVAGPLSHDTCSRIVDRDTERLEYIVETGLDPDTGGKIAEKEMELAKRMEIKCVLQPDRPKITYGE